MPKNYINWNQNIIKSNYRGALGDNVNEYLRLVSEAQNKRIQLTKEQVKNIRDLYKEVSKDLSKRAKKANKNSLNKRWLKDYEKQFKDDIKELNKILRKNIEKSIVRSAEYATGIQMNFFDMLSVRYELNTKETFSNMFSQIPQEVLQELINGEIYKDGRGLSERLWFNGVKANADFDYIIQKGILEKKSTYELAKDLAYYVNPEVKKNWNFKKIYPNVGNKKIEYNSFRLAVTSISHAYQLSLQRSCKANPFVEGIKWNTSNSHRDTCNLCRSRNGKIYTPDTLPLDHPNGICTFTPVINKTLEDIGTELHDWLYNKGNNPKLDKWLDDYGKEFGIEKNSDIIDNIRNDIKSGKYPLKILEGKQGKHIREHNNYTEGRSYLTISINEAQEIVNKYAGSGIIRLNQNNEWDNKEVITVDKEIGVNVNNMTNEESETNRCKIHYSKKGTHIVPTKKE